HPGNPFGFEVASVRTRISNQKPLSHQDLSQISEIIISVGCHPPNLDSRTNGASRCSWQLEFQGDARMQDEREVLFEKKGRFILEQRLGDLGYSFNTCMNEGRSLVLAFHQQDSWFVVTLEDDAVYAEAMVGDDAGGWQRVDINGLLYHCCGIRLREISGWEADLHRINEELFSACKPYVCLQYGLESDPRFCFPISLEGKNRWLKLSGILSSDSVRWPDERLE
ncbi:hypothetical protein, partial [Rhodopirellula bahusiensis]